MDYARPALAEALAAQYVAGTLRGRARSRLEALLPAHPALRDAVGQWQQRLLPLTGVVAEVVPPLHVWHAIERRLGLAPAAAPTAAASVPFWHRLATWRSISGVALAGVAALALLLAQPEVTGPPVVVVLERTDAGADALPGGTVVVASFSADGRSLVAHSVAPSAPAGGRVLELWALPPAAQGGAPRSLGLIAASGTTVVARDRLPPALLDGGAGGLAVSVEPPGGSPTGAPTGPVVFSGRLRL